MTSLARPALLAVSAASAVLALAGPASADPVTRVISPNGTGIECTMQNPCSYGWALSSGSASGDTVLALPGTYDLTTLAVDITHPLTVTADPTQPRPKFRNTASQGTVFTVEGSAGGTVLRHLDLEAAGGGFQALTAYGQVDASDLTLTSDNRCASLFISGSSLTDSTLTQNAGSVYPCLQTLAPSTLRGLTVDAGGQNPSASGVYLQNGGTTFEDSTVSGAKALSLSDNPYGESTARRLTLRGSVAGIAAYQFSHATVTDSVVTAAGGGRAAYSAAGTELRLRNVTAGATGNGATALEAAAALSTLSPGSIDARNVIARGDGHDVVSDGSPNPAGCTPAPCGPGTVKIDHSDFGTSAGPVQDGGANIAGDPLFADAGTGDFHLLPGSPAIDAGVDDPLNGPTDRDGRARAQGSGVDIGAFESTPPPPQPPAGPQSPPASPPAGPAADTTPPLLSALRVTRRTFKVGRTATATAAGARAGTTFRYTLSEPATVTIKIERGVGGRAFKQAATLTRTGRAGTNSTAFSGRAGRRALRPGTYRATLTARDAAGNHSKAVRVGFRIVRR